VAASGNINPTGVSMFEPIHGSAPKYTGQNVICPIATIAAAAMMLDHLGEAQAARSVEASVKAVLAAGSVRTPDLGGSSGTEDVAAAVIANLR